MVRDPQLLTRLARLRAEVTIDSGAMDQRAEELAALLAGWQSHGAVERAKLVLIAVNLHGYYTALETLCERIARQLDENLPTGPSWHSDLLAQMQVEVPGLRPRVIAAEITDELHELRKFRHFFRNAYVIDFDPALVRAHAERACRLHRSLTSTLSTFRRYVDDLLVKLSEG